MEPKAEDKENPTDSVAIPTPETTITPTEPKPEEPEQTASSDDPAEPDTESEVVPVKISTPEASEESTMPEEKPTDQPSASAESAESEPEVAAVDPTGWSSEPKIDAPTTAPASPEPVTSISPSEAPVAPVTPIGDVLVAPVVGGVTADQAPAAVVSKSGHKKKALIIGAVAASVVVIGSLAFYLGYYSNPSVILSQALKNSGTGYSKLTKYYEDQSKLKYKGVASDGSYTLGVGSFATDGKMSFNSDGENSEATLDVNAGATRVSFDGRTIKNKTDIPDFYFKLSGLDGLSKLLGGSDYASLLNTYNNQWIGVDQSFITSLEKASGQDASSLSIKPPTQEQINDELEAFGKVNQDYLFTTDKSKSITTVVKKLGKETVDGHHTYHYQMALDKANVKKYITAQRDALKASKFDDWLKANKYDNYIGIAYDSLEQAADKIKSSDTFDLWADTSNRIVYKVRFADTKNPSTNYVDVGFDYKGGDNLPFFIKFNSKDGSDTTAGSFVTTVNTKTNKTTLDAEIKSSGADAVNFKANVNIKPTNDVTKITAPTGSIPLTQLLDKLGLSDYLTGLTSLSGSSSGMSAEQSQKCAAAEEAYVNSDGKTPIPAECE